MLNREQNLEGFPSLPQDKLATKLIVALSPG